MSAIPAVVELDFNPWLEIGGLMVRWEAVILALVIGICLLMFGLAARRMVGVRRADDLIFIVLAVLPGAVVGGRLVHALDFAQVYAAQPQTLLDLGRGSLSLVGAVAGGVLTGAYVARLLAYRSGAWLDAAAVPLLFAIGAGKLAMALGGAGQGAASSEDWATAYPGTGWVSSAAATPAHPSQIYEGLWTFLGAVLLLLLTRSATETRFGNGRRFLAALLWWLFGRFVIAFTWRDEPVVGSLGAEQVATGVLLLLALLALPILTWRRRRRQRRKRRGVPARGVVATGAVLVSLIGALLPAAGVRGASTAADAGAPARFVVLLRDDDKGSASSAGRSVAARSAPELDARRSAGAHVDRVTSAYAIRPSQRYVASIHGFAAELTPAQAAELRRDPRVASVTPDEPVLLAAESASQPSTAFEPAGHQTIPAPIRRVRATASPLARIDGVDQPMDVDVAVLDTGIAPHPDLRVVGGHDCSSDTPSAWRDRFGHGTHVAGTVAAKDNSLGVVGVAPGARLWAVKVFDDEARGFISTYLCGIDWVAAQRDPSDPGKPLIEVANMSWDSWLPTTDDHDCKPGSNDPVHVAVCGLVAAGTTAIAAAGNDHVNASLRLPGAYPEAIAVSALADYDGKPGGTGSRPSGCTDTRPDADDTFADFSNYGRDVDIMAPGKCVLSTLPGGYGWSSGTSMAAPVVAGAAALVYAAHPNANPALVRQALLRATNLGWQTGTDPDGHPDRLLDVSKLGALPGLSIDALAPADDLVVSGLVRIPITLNRSAGFTAAVGLDVTGGLPDGVTAEFGPDRTSGGTATLTLKAARPLDAGSFNVTVRARGGGLSRSTNVSVGSRGDGVRMAFDAPASGLSLRDAAKVHVSLEQIGAGPGPSHRTVLRQHATQRQPGTCANAAWQDAGGAQSLGSLDPDGSVGSGWSFKATGLQDGCQRWIVRLSFDDGSSTTFASGAVIVDTQAPPRPDVRGSGSGTWQRSTNDDIWVRGGVSGTLHLAITGPDPASGTASTSAAVTEGHGFSVSAAPGSGGHATATLKWTGGATDTTLRVASTDATGHAGATRVINLRVDRTDPAGPRWSWPPAGQVTQLVATPELLWAGGSDSGSGFAALQRVQRKRGAIRHAGSCSGVSWSNDGPARLLDRHHVERDVQSGYCYRYVLTALDQVGNRGPKVRSGVMLVDVTAPTGNFTTPNEGTTTVTSLHAITVRWTEHETGGSGGLLSRRLERERGPIVNAGSCAGVFWQPDGASDSGASPSPQSGLVSGYCYRWRLNLVDRSHMAGVAISGAVLVKN